MAITYLDVIVKNPQNQKKSVTGHFLVDSGVVYSVMPASMLKKLDIRPTDTQKFTPANGEMLLM